MKENNIDMVPMAQLPLVQRDLYLARALNNGETTFISTLLVEFPGIWIQFDSDAATGAAVVSVADDVNLKLLAKVMEQLLDCWAPGQGEWVLKWSDANKKYGSLQEIQLALCDRIVTIEADGTTIGAFKRKRKSVVLGHGTVAISRDSFQVILRHTSAQGLKALWKSVFSRLDRIKGRG